MPDVLTHLLVGISLVVLLRPKGTRVEQTLIILGALLIDIERPITWILKIFNIDWIPLTSTFHSILGAVILSYLAAACFVLDDFGFKDKFQLLFVGCLSHLLMDLTMYPWTEYGLYLFYPVKLAFSFHLMWSDSWLYPFFGGLILIIAFGIRLCSNFIEKMRVSHSSEITSKKVS